MKNLILCVLVAFIAGQSTAVAVRASEESKPDPFAWHWYEADEEGNLRMNLYLFWRSTCPHCPRALEYARRLDQRHGWLRVRTYEISQHAGNLELYRRMAQSLNRPAGQVPAFFFCQQLVLSLHSDEDGARRIEEPLVHCYQYLLEQWKQQRQPAQEGTPSGEEVQRASTDNDPQHGPDTVPHDAEDRDQLGTLGFPRSAPAHVFALETWDMASSFPRILAQVYPEETANTGADAPGAPTVLEGLSPPQEPPEESTIDEPGLGLPLELELPPPAVQEEIVELPFLGATNAGEWSLPVLTLVLAGCDAFNPCAFFVLLSLLSLLIHARSRWRILVIGGVFVLFSGLFYFVFMAAWLNVFFLAGHLKWITIFAGALAVVIALINIKDYFLFRRGISLSIPDAAKPGLFDRMRRLVESAGAIPMLLGTLGLAVAANSYELLCTAGFPMVFTRVLTLNELSVANYYGYLALYNVIYVIPLAAIVAVFTVTLGRRKLSEFEGRLLKLLSGVMMLLLGLIIIAAPALLQNVGTAVAILAGAVVLTAAVAGGDIWIRSRRRVRPDHRGASSATRERDHVNV